MKYLIVQPWGSGPSRFEQATIVSEHATAAEAFAELDRLRSGYAIRISLGMRRARCSWWMRSAVWSHHQAHEGWHRMELTVTQGRILSLLKRTTDPGLRIIRAIASALDLEEREVEVALLKLAAGNHVRMHRETGTDAWQIREIPSEDGPNAMRVNGDGGPRTVGELVAVLWTLHGATEALVRCTHGARPSSWRRSAAKI